MKVTRSRPVLIAAAALLLSSCALFRGDSAPAVHAPRETRAGTPVKLAPGQWPQAKSDVAPAPEVRFGSLPNGMRYAIQQNATPPGQASLRLRFDAGSLEETDDQQGLAHFLEHMAFNGSKAIPEGEMVKILERHGLAFGPDTNASTSWTETVYQLDLPKTDADSVDTAMTIMRQVASELTIAQDAVDRERGVVLSEERARDTPSYRVFKSRLGFLMKGQRPPLRYPIGQVQVLQNAPNLQIIDFYRKYYRPERAVLVAVGDFDVDQMEAKIRAAFADWKGEGPAGADADPGAPLPRGPEAMVAVEPGSQLNLQIAWVAPPDLAPDTLAKRRRDWRERLGFAVLNRRLEHLARQQDAPFISAAGFRGDQLHAADVAILSVTAKPGAWQAALAAVEQEQRRAVAYGVRADELAREIEEYRARLTTAADGAATRRTAALAAEITASLDDDEIVTSPAQDLALFEQVVKDLKPEDVSKALADAFTGSGPLIFLASPDPVEGDEAAVMAAFNASRAVEVTPPAAPTVNVWPYDSFGAPGKVAERRDVLDLDTVFVRFENGVRLTIKPTHFRDQQVLVRADIGHGRLTLPSDRQNLTWASQAVILGGLGQISHDDMERLFASKVLGANFSVDDDNFTLSGETRTGDLDSQLQVLAAYAVDPGWRPQAFQRIQSYVATLRDQYQATDSGVLSRDLPGLMHGGDRRWTFPQPADITGATPDAVTAAFAPALASGPIEVVIVGDVTVDKAIEAAAATFGALPPRADIPPSSQGAVTGFPRPGGPVVLTHGGRDDQAIGYIAWRTDDFFSDPQRARNVAVLSEVMRLRLIEELRENQGVTYAPQVSFHHSRTFTDWGYLSAQIEAPPAKLEAFFADVLAIAADLRNRPVDADLLERARKPRVESLQKARQTNEYWLSELAGAQDDPRRLDAIRALVPGTERVTAADIQAAARQFLADDNAWMLSVRPAR
ncbi:MAG TPA: insulinase family protein [Caulobacteraceae bacterium]